MLDQFMKLWLRRLIEGVLVFFFAQFWWVQRRKRKRKLEAYSSDQVLILFFLITGSLPRSLPSSYSTFLPSLWTHDKIVIIAIFIWQLSQTKQIHHPQLLLDKPNSPKTTVKYFALDSTQCTIVRISKFWNPKEHTKTFPELGSLQIKPLTVHIAMYQFNLNHTQIHLKWIAKQ